MSTGVHVDIDNETDVELDLDRWSALVRDALVAEGVTGPAEVGVRFVAPEVIAELNRTHLDGDGPTDVLAFPLDDESATPPRLVGDIVVCPFVVEANAPGHAGTFDDELALVLVHSVLHLLGHDHAADDDRRTMWAAERRLLDRLWSPLARDPWGEP